MLLTTTREVQTQNVTLYLLKDLFEMNFVHAQKGKYKRNYVFRISS